MKKIIICTMLLIIATTTFSQQSNPSPTLIKQDYLQKSKRQKIAAFVLAGGSAVLMIAGTFKVASGIQYNGPATPGFILIGIGVGSYIGGLQLLHASRKNKKKAMSLSFKNDTTQQLQKSSFVYRPVPSLTLKISL